MKKLGLSCLLALGVSASAQAEVSANIAVSNDYVWRGVSQTGGEAAVSGGVDYSNDGGFYAGVWTSNVDFGGANGQEVDLYAGFATDAFDVGYIYYAYPNDGNNNADFGEIYVSGNLGPVTAGLAYTVNGVRRADQTDSIFAAGDIYYHISTGGDLSGDWSWGATIGYYDFDNDSSDNEVSYAHWLVEAGKSVGEFGDFAIAISGAEAESGDNDPILLVSWAKGF